MNFLNGDEVLAGLKRGAEKFGTSSAVRVVRDMARRLNGFAPREPEPYGLGMGGSETEQTGPLNNDKCKECGYGLAETGDREGMCDNPRCGQSKKPVENDGGSDFRSGVCYQCNQPMEEVRDGGDRYHWWCGRCKLSLPSGQKKKNAVKNEDSAGLGFESAQRTTTAERSDLDNSDAKRTAAEMWDQALLDSRRQMLEQVLPLEDRDRATIYKGKNWADLPYDMKEMVKEVWVRSRKNALPEMLSRCPACGHESEEAWNGKCESCLVRNAEDVGGSRAAKENSDEVKCPYCAGVKVSVKQLSEHIRKNHPGVSDPDGIADGERQELARREKKNAGEACRCGHPHDGDVCDDCSCRIFVARENADHPGTWSQAFDVYHDGRKIDTVFFTSNHTPEEVKRSLVEHDGHPSTITVKKGTERKNAGKDELSGRHICECEGECERTEDSLKHSGQCKNWNMPGSRFCVTCTNDTRDNAFKPGCGCGHQYDDHHPGGGGAFPCGICKCETYHKRPGEELQLTRKNAGKFYAVLDTDKAEVHGPQFATRAEATAWANEQNKDGKVKGYVIRENASDDANPSCEGCGRELSDAEVDEAVASGSTECAKCRGFETTMHRTTKFEKKNAGHLGPDSWMAASLDERVSWLEAAGMDINEATRGWHDLSATLHVALQRAFDEPASVNNNLNGTARENGFDSAASLKAERDALNEHLDLLTRELHQIEGQDGAHSHDREPAVQRILARMKELERGIAAAHVEYLRAHERGNADPKCAGCGSRATKAISPLEACEGCGERFCADCLEGGRCSPCRRDRQNAPMKNSKCDWCGGPGAKEVDVPGAPTVCKKCFISEGGTEKQWNEGGAYKNAGLSCEGCGKALTEQTAATMDANRAGKALCEQCFHKRGMRHSSDKVCPKCGVELKNAGPAPRAVEEAPDDWAILCGAERVREGLHKDEVAGAMEELRLENAVENYGAGWDKSTVEQEIKKAEAKVAQLDRSIAGLAGDYHRKQEQDEMKAERQREQGMIAEMRKELAAGPRKNDGADGDLAEIARHAEGIEHEVEELAGGRMNAIGTCTFEGEHGGCSGPTRRYGTLVFAGEKGTPLCKKHAGMEGYSDSEALENADISKSEIGEEIGHHVRDKDMPQKQAVAAVFGEAGAGRKSSKDDPFEAKNAGITRGASKYGAVKNSFFGTVVDKGNAAKGLGVFSYEQDASGVITDVGPGGFDVKWSKGRVSNGTYGFGSAKIYTLESVMGRD